MDCQYCNKHFTTKYLLTQHQTKTKYCLELQGKHTTIFECQYCKKCLSTNERLVTHLNICKNKKQSELCDKDRYYQEIIASKDKEIACYEEKLEKQKAEYEAKLEKFENAVIASATESRSKTTTITTNYNTNSNNTNTNQFLNLSREVIEPILRQKLTFADARRGQKGLANMVVNNLLKDEDGQLLYKCKDAARQNFEFVDENGDVKKDVHANKLIQALIDSKVEKIAGEVGNKEWKDDIEKFKVHNEKVTEIVMLSKDNSAFRSELTALTS